nr:MAG TPA: hypothetical protein [Caudoviricetes sp.]
MHSSSPSRLLVKVAVSSTAFTLILIACPPLCLMFPRLLAPHQARNLLPRVCFLASFIIYHLTVLCNAFF